MSDDIPLLELVNVSRHYPSGDGTVMALDDVAFMLRRSIQIYEK